MINSKTQSSLWATLDMLAEASVGNPRILGLFAQTARLEAPRHNALTIDVEHIHKSPAPGASR
jgi:hypothetical protein